MKLSPRALIFSGAYLVGGGVILFLILDGSSGTSMIVVGIAWFSVCAISPFLGSPGKHRYFLSSLAAVMVFAAIVWPTISAWLIRRSVIFALHDADSVRLEEFFKGGSTITSVELARSDWPQVAAAMPIVPDIGLPGGWTFCFIPHHRVILSDVRGDQFELIVCFECDESWTKPSELFQTPYGWRTPLRHLFTDHHVPIRDRMEYSRLRAESPPPGH